MTLDEARRAAQRLSRTLGIAMYVVWHGEGDYSVAPFAASSAIETYPATPFQPNHGRFEIAAASDPSAT